MAFSQLSLAGLPNFTSLHTTLVSSGIPLSTGEAEEFGATEKVGSMAQGRFDNGISGVKTIDVVDSEVDELDC